jgi:hypothetical protein
MTPFRASRTQAVIALVAIGFGAGGTGCALFTDLDTDPYTLASDGGRSGEASACDSGSCPNLVFDCRSSGDCQDGGVCCLTPVSTSSAAFACQATACTTLPAVQLCATDAECSGTSCTRQGCSVNGLVVEVGACGVLLGCSAL